MPDDPQAVSAEENERNTLLLSSIADLVPNPGITAEMGRVLAVHGAPPQISALLKGYGEVINILGSAIEYDDAQPPMTLHDRLSSAYYELTNTDPSAPDTEIRLRDDEEDDDGYSG